MLNVGRLQVLCEVVRRGSFSAAADALSYTQSAVSQAVARLEAETGSTLVIRDRRGVRPTLDCVSKRRSKRNASPSDAHGTPCARRR